MFNFMKKKPIKVKKDTEFLGFLDNYDVVDAGIMASLLRKPALSNCFISNEPESTPPTSAYVVEKLASIKGVEFLTPAEIREKYPDAIKNKSEYIYAATFPPEPGEIIKQREEFKNRYWCYLSMAQYMYALYLMDALKSGKLSIVKE